MNTERCPYLGGLNGVSCRSTRVIQQIAEGDGNGVSAKEWGKLLCLGGEIDICPGYTSLKTDGRHSPWCK
jgi:hypothetical protein